LLRIVPHNGKVLINGDEETGRSLISDCPAPVTTVGLGEHCEVRIQIVEAAPAHTDFKLGEDAFSVPMVGEFNVRNAAMAICAARFAGLSDEQIRSGLASFKGVRRRQSERGTVRGITIVDDFGHHPTAIRETLRGLRQKYPGARLWALFEPRSNTSRRKMMQQELINALREADGSIIAAVNRPEKVPAGQLLDVDAVADELRAAGRQAFHEPDVDAIIARLKPLAQSGDVVVVFSNGGFDGIHQKLMDRLK
jgi:UDP-N-acetylmuramate: L-alanyl-gamma-D-glutamyl-meso-diaminopimelate ligase